VAGLCQMAVESRAQEGYEATSMSHALAYVWQPMKRCAVGAGVIKPDQDHAPTGGYQGRVGCDMALFCSASRLKCAKQDFVKGNVKAAGGCMVAQYTLANS